RVAVAEDEMGGKPLKQPDGIGILDVAAVEEKVHAPALQQAQGGLHRLVTAVRVAEYADPHDHHPASDRPAWAFTRASTKKWSPQATDSSTPRALWEW